MPIRKLEAINAGSMADIAFLLLIFFIVTTTMSLETGIVQTLPKQTQTDAPIMPRRDRDVFAISINADNALFVEGEPTTIEALPDLLYHFYTANMFSLEQNPEQVEYIAWHIAEVKAALKTAEAIPEPERDIITQSNIKALKKRLNVCRIMPNKTFFEISNQGVVQIKQKANTHYGSYIAVKTAIGQVINDLRNEWSKELFDGLSYYDLDQTKAIDQTKIEVLTTLVPGRVIEPDIKN